MSLCVKIDANVQKDDEPKKFKTKWEDLWN